MIYARLFINRILIGIILFEHMPEDKYFLEAIFNKAIILNGCLEDVRFCKSEDNKTHILIEYDSSDRGYYEEDDEIQPSLFKDIWIPNNNLKEIMLPEYAAFVWSTGYVFCPKDIYTEVYEFVSSNYPYDYEYIVNHI